MRSKLPLMLLVAACVNQPGAPDDDVEQVTSALETDGGYDMADEAAMFGVQDTFADAAVEPDFAYDDTMATDSTVVAMNQSPTTDARDVIVLWGRFPGQPGAQEARDWSGRLELSRGGMIVRRRIAFEDATDRVLPRQDPRTVEFRSITRPFADGLALGVL